jgi:hypothetical protein
MGKRAASEPAQFAVSEETTWEDILDFKDADPDVSISTHVPLQLMPGTISTVNLFRRLLSCGLDACHAPLQAVEDLASVLTVVCGASVRRFVKTSTDDIESPTEPTSAGDIVKKCMERMTCFCTR